MRGFGNTDPKSEGGWPEIRPESVSRGSTEHRCHRYQSMPEFSSAASSHAGLYPSFGRPSPPDFGPTFPAPLLRTPKRSGRPLFRVSGVPRSRYLGLSRTERPWRDIAISVMAGHAGGPIVVEIRARRPHSGVGCPLECSNLLCLHTLGGLECSLGAPLPRLFDSAAGLFWARRCAWSLAGALLHLHA